MKLWKAFRKSNKIREIIQEFPELVKQVGSAGKAIRVSLEKGILTKAEIEDLTVKTKNLEDKTVELVTLLHEIL